MQLNELFQIELEALISNLLFLNSKETFICLLKTQKLIFISKTDSQRCLNLINESIQDIAYNYDDDLLYFITENDLYIYDFNGLQLCLKISQCKYKSIIYQDNILFCHNSKFQEVDLRNGYGILLKSIGFPSIYELKYDFYSKINLLGKNKTFFIYSNFLAPNLIPFKAFQTIKSIEDEVINIETLFKENLFPFTKFVEKIVEKLDIVENLFFNHIDYECNRLELNIQDLNIKEEKIFGNIGAFFYSCYSSFPFLTFELFDEEYDDTHVIPFALSDVLEQVNIIPIAQTKEHVEIFMESLIQMFEKISTIFHETIPGLMLIIIEEFEHFNFDSLELYNLLEKYFSELKEWFFSSKHFSQFICQFLMLMIHQKPSPEKFKAFETFEEIPEEIFNIKFFFEKNVYLLIHESAYLQKFLTI
eukprot:TRINITY_DN14594_c0_g1_i1.p1 TRINITY_DN14594_c0_g1~~TRINITY_DN14594_c0_g1_i1.p1  ORF type:complete len:418 (-),score=115.46 TRINITY_DN14594_c0_g1_i1:124-1377(-)